METTSTLYLIKTLILALNPVSDFMISETASARLKVGLKQLKKMLQLKMKKSIQVKEN